MADFSQSVADRAFDLSGMTLVEASAGTGKTYSLQNVYLRLILERDIPVEKLLVVTFTEAATHELRERLRRILSSGVRYFEEGEAFAEDDDYARVAGMVAIARAGTPAPTDAELKSRLKLALMEFDNAAIFTIHGFCTRVLERYAFECGHDPAAELVTDESHIIERMALDWWREHTYQSARFRATVPFKNVAELQDYVKEYLRRPEVVLRPEPQSESVWGRLEEELAEALAAYRGVMEGGVGGGKPNADAGRFTAHVDGVARLIEPASRDLCQTRELLKELAGYRKKARVTQPVGAFPGELAAVVAAAAEAWDGVGSLRSAMAWTGSGGLAKKDGSRVDLGELRRSIQCARDELLGWLAAPDHPLKTAKRVGAFCAALQALCDDATAGPAGGDASAFCRDILKPLGTMTPGNLFADGKLTVAEIGPQLVESLEAINTHVLGAMVAMIREVGERVRDEIRARSVMTYSDMLRNVFYALQKPETGARLRGVLQAEFAAAMIDEFQDTDPIQYGIFYELFGEAGVPLLFVGDPKQAIYGFRGGDIFTYYSARAAVAAERRQALHCNYRSEEALVGAVNDLFRDLPEARTFLNGNLPYDGSLAARGFKAEQSLTIGGEEAPAAIDPRPLKIWHYDTAGRMPSSKAPAAMRIYADVADEIVRVLDDAQTQIAGQRVGARDVAVLVRTHSEADLMHHELRERRVNVVRQSTGNVFDTPEAGDFGLLIKALIDPTDARLVRGALATALLPCSLGELQQYSVAADELPAGEDDERGVPVSLEGWIDVMKLAGERWRKRSFIEAFRLLADTVLLQEHLLKSGDGERRLTNVLQLAELAHGAASESHQGPLALLAWFQEQLVERTREGNETFETRLSSDSDAVTIMTIHKSKGLQFPVVFVPTMWRKQAIARQSRSRTLVYHGDGDALVMDLDTDREMGKERAQQESLQEDMRLIYVAVTRAVHRAYVCCTNAGDVEAYALPRLLDRDLTEAAAICWEERATESETEPLCLTVPEEGAIELRVCGEGRVDKRHGHTSFSELEPASRERQEFVRRDVDAQTEESGERTPQSATDIFSIPGGASTGDCWHNIFEHLDFTVALEEQLPIVERELERYQVCGGATEEIAAGRRAAVYAMVQRVLAASMTLPGTSQPLQLKQVSLACRRSEMGFNFALKQDGAARRTELIRAVLEQELPAGANRDAFLEVLGSWDRDLPRGFMTGFIDLLCCHEGRFYILDWKSNRRSGCAEDFGVQGVRDEMARNAYFLQYLFYTVAVDGFLRRDLEGYDYDRHFGGVFYVFLRGVTGKGNAGIFADRPSKRLIGALSEVLTGSAGGEA